MKNSRTINEEKFGNIEMTKKIRESNRDTKQSRDSITTLTIELDCFPTIK